MAYEIALGSERLCTVHRALKGGRLVSADTRRLVLDTVRLLNEEKIAAAARLEHHAEKMQTSLRQPTSLPFGE